MSEERTCRCGQLEEHAVVTWQMEVQRRDVRRAAWRRGVAEAVDPDPDLAAVFERRDHISPRQKE